MTETKTYRPGVYSTYSIKNGNRIYAQRYAFTCGSAKTKPASNLKAGGVIQINTIEQLDKYFEAVGTGEIFYSACKILLLNGVPGVYAVPITIDGTSADITGYTAAFNALAEVKRPGIILCQSVDEAIIQKMKTMIEACSLTQREKVGVAAIEKNLAVALAASLNCERIVICAQKATALGSGNTKNYIAAAAEIAGKLAAMASDDKLSSLPLQNIGELEDVNEVELETLLGGGVTVLEKAESGEVECVRAVTTRTKTGEESDRTFSSVNVVMMIDEIIRAVRTRLQAMIRGGNNFGKFTLDSISSQVAIVLEEKKQDGLIINFEPPLVSQDSTDPQVCLVEMAFHITPVISQIYLTAQIEI